MERAFSKRAEAGRQLAEKLETYAGREDVIVLGLPRGGVPVAYEVAKRLNAPLDVFIVRKLGVPGFEELAAGAIASGGVRVLNEDVVRAIPYATEAIEAVTAKETAELQRREQIYREGRPAPELREKIVILVDDGLATGATMRDHARSGKGTATAVCGENSRGSACRAARHLPRACTESRRSHLPKHASVLSSCRPVLRRLFADYRRRRARTADPSCSGW